MPPTLQENLTRLPLLRILLAIITGVALGLSFPGFGLTKLAFLAFIPLICAVVTARGAWGAFGLGWTALTVTWLINVPWVIAVMKTHGGIPLSVGITLYVALAMVLGLYGAFFAVLVWWLRLGERFGPWMMIPLAWSVSEYARAHLINGFPWNLLAEAIVDTTFIQVDRFVGPYAIGALMTVPSVIIAWNIIQPMPKRKPVISLIWLAIFLIAWGVIGGMVMVQEQSRIRNEEKTTVALLQPNISQQMRWDEGNLYDIFSRMIEMTDSAIAQGAKTVIWPESTVPLSFATTDFYRDWVESTSRERDVNIILGSVAEDPKDHTKIWNSAYLVSDGTIISRYDKMKLAPFGEYVPFRRLLSFAPKLVKDVGEFQFGTNSHPLKGRFAYGPAICYEILYPEVVANQVRHGADLLVTITNDGWFERTAAPEQHFDGARLRAIETDRWLVRSATTGITAIVDPTGRIVERLPVDQQAMIVGGVAARTNETLYVRFGDWFAIASIIAVAAFVILRRRRKDA